jgi:hypothetical protein
MESIPSVRSIIFSWCYLILHLWSCVVHSWVLSLNGRAQNARSQSHLKVRTYAGIPFGQYSHANVFLEVGLFLLDPINHSLRDVLFGHFISLNGRPSASFYIHTLAHVQVEKDSCISGVWITINGYGGIARHDHV